jgi:hypothetical protein
MSDDNFVPYDAFPPLHSGMVLTQKQIDMFKDMVCVVRCKDCKYRSFYCTEATDGTTVYTCHHPCANSVCRPGDWFCADGERKEGR